MSCVRVAPLGPRRSKLCIACSDFFQKSERTHAAAPPFKTANAALVCGLMKRRLRRGRNFSANTSHGQALFGLLFFSAIPASNNKEASRCPARLLSVFRPLFCAQNGRSVRPQGRPPPGRPSRDRSRTAAARRRPHPARRQAGAKRAAHPAACAANRRARR